MGGLGSILGLSWWILEGSWEVLGRILEAFWDMGGLAKTYGFRSVFNDFGVFWGSGRESSGHLGDYVGRCWVQDGSKMGSRGVRIRFFCPIWRLGGHLGAKMAT